MAEPDDILISSLKRILERRETLARGDARLLLDDILERSHRHPDQLHDQIRIAALLGALASRGETTDELAGFVDALRGRVTRLPLSDAERSQLVAPVISANGTADAVLWVIDQGNNFRAVNPANFTELYDSAQAAGGRDTPPTFMKFNSPVIANGKVFVGGQGALAVYGELP